MEEDNAFLYLFHDIGNGCPLPGLSSRTGAMPENNVENREEIIAALSCPPNG